MVIGAPADDIHAVFLQNPGQRLGIGDHLGRVSLKFGRKYFLESHRLGGELTVLLVEIDSFTDFEQKYGDNVSSQVFETIGEFRGRVSQQTVVDTSAFERLNYIRVLDSYSFNPEA